MDKLKELFNLYKKPIIIPTVVLFAIGVIIALALAGANAITSPTIAELDKKAQNEAMQRVIKADDYTLSIVDTDGGKTEFYTAEKGGKTVGYIFTFSEKGYGGDVKVMTAIDTDGSIVAVDILDASGETPGLGQNVTKESFFKQYSGIKGEVSVVKGGADKESSTVDAVTGATISSKAVTRAVNRAVGTYDIIKGNSTGGAKK